MRCEEEDKDNIYAKRLRRCLEKNNRIFSYRRIEKIFLVYAKRLTPLSTEEIKILKKKTVRRPWRPANVTDFTSSNRLYMLRRHWRLGVPFA
jgi:hypothetical protein